MDTTFEMILGEVLDFYWFKTESVKTFHHENSTIFIFTPKHSEQKEFKWIDAYGLSKGFQISVIEAFRRMVSFNEK